MKSNNGITLLTLIVTIVVMLIIVSTTMSTLTGDSGLIARAQETSFKNKIGQYLEELNLYKNSKKTSNSMMKVDKLPQYASNSILKENGENIVGQNIRDVIPSMGRTEAKNFIILNGYLYIREVNNDTEEQWAKDMGVLKLDLEIDVNGTLISTKYNEVLIRDDTLYLPDSVKSIGEAAFSFLDVETVVIPSTVTSITRNAFAANQKIKTLIIETDENGMGCQSIGNEAFYNCTSLQKIVMGNSVKTIGDRAFRNCSNLTDIKFSDNITTINGLAFAGCTKLSEITLPKMLQTIGGEAFSGTAIANLDIPMYLKNLEGSAIPQNIKTITTNNNSNFKFVDNILYQKLSDGTYNVILATKYTTTVNFAYTVSKISNYAFSRCTKNLTINIPASVTTIGDRAFNNSITKVTIDKANKNFKVENDMVLSFDGKILYRAVKASSNITIPEGVEHLKRGWYNSSVKITVINLPISYKGDSIWGLFPAMSSLTLPMGVTQVDGTSLYQISSINVSTSNPKFKSSSDGKCIFSQDGKTLYWVSTSLNPTELVAIIKKNSVTKIAARALTKYPSSSLDLSSTNLEGLEESAFYESNLNSIILPTSIKNINSNAFGGVNFLKSVTVNYKSEAVRKSLQETIPWGATCGKKGIEWVKK